MDSNKATLFVSCSCSKSKAIFTSQVFSATIHCIVRVSKLHSIPVLLARCSISIEWLPVSYVTPTVSLWATSPSAAFAVARNWYCSLTIRPQQQQHQKSLKRIKIRRNTIYSVVLWSCIRNTDKLKAIGTAPLNSNETTLIQPEVIQ